MSDPAGREPETASSKAGEALPWVSRHLLAALCQSGVVTVVVVAALNSFSRDVDFVSAWAIAAVCFLALRLHRALLPSKDQRRGLWNAMISQGQTTFDVGLDATRTGPQGEQGLPTRSLGGSRDTSWVDPLPPTLERRFKRMYRHTDRLTYAVVAVRHYDTGVRPVLADIAADRLRRHHAVVLANEPIRARALLGSDLWRAITEPASRPPTIADLDRWVTALEALDPGHSPPMGAATTTPRPDNLPGKVLR